VVQEAKRAAHRPSGLTEKLVAAAFVMAELGATDMDLARAFDVDISTIYAWKAKDRDFSDALKVGKATADDKVERALYQKAVGYSLPLTKVFCHEGVISTHQMVEHFPPDTTACIFWLKNRRSDEWREKREVEVHDKLSEFMAELNARPRLVEINRARLIEAEAMREGETGDD
tara:strand:+ start:1864 stop:2382 length:519 start_codon:yes stop_codon:yes gene_type:complete